MKVKSMKFNDISITGNEHQIDMAKCGLRLAINRLEQYQITLYEDGAVTASKFAGRNIQALQAIEFLFDHADIVAGDGE